jgi:hypothetical protein
VIVGLCQSADAAIIDDEVDKVVVAASDGVFEVFVASYFHGFSESTFEDEPSDEFGVASLDIGAQDPLKVIWAVRIPESGNKALVDIPVSRVPDRVSNGVPCE